MEVNGEKQCYNIVNILRDEGAKIVSDILKSNRTLIKLNLESVNRKSKKNNGTEIYVTKKQTTKLEQKE